MRRTPLFPTLLAAAAVAAGAPATTAQATAEPDAAPYRATYDVFIGGLRGGELRLTVHRDGEAYAAEAALRASGLVGAFFGAEARASATGVESGAAPEPARFESETRFGRERREVAMRWEENPSIVIEADPPLRRRRYDAPPETLRGALDPVSAAVAALTPRPVAEACGRTVPVFDSRRRFDIALGEGALDGDTLRCEGVYRRVAGYKTITAENVDHPFTAWWTVVDGVAHFERLQTPTPIGHAVARRR
ncbi:MAG: DUF3108 domain-containing protein [Rhodobacteraceae bacterium]|nr:MAG: DUF3108 domain-containing protein [Paracoccaceae bacterium]